MIRFLGCTATALVLAFSSLQAEPEINRASQVLTADEAAQILGANSAPSLRNQLPDVAHGKTWTSTASWSTTVGTDRTTLTLLLRHGASAAQTQTSFDASRESLHGEPVAALGDAAFRTANPAQLNVLQGADWLILSVCTLLTPRARAPGKSGPRNRRETAEITPNEKRAALRS